MLKKNPTAQTITSTTGYTKEDAFLVDMDNIGAGDATITNADGTTWVLKAGTSKSIATGTPMDVMTIDASATTVQILYTF